MENQDLSQAPERMEKTFQNLTHRRYLEQVAAKEGDLVAE